MKYYSRTPEEMRRYLEVKGEPCKKAKKRSMMLQLINLGMLAVIISIFGPKLKEMVSNNKNLKEQLNGSTIHWNGYKIGAHCQRSSCTVELEFTENFSVQFLSVRIINSIDRIIIFNSSKKIEYTKEKGQTLLYELPFKLDSNLNVYLSLLDKSTNEIASFQIYPEN